MPYRVLHILDHSWPVLSGYSTRSRSLVTAQHRLGHEVRALTGPLHQLDDPQGSDTALDGVSYLRTLLGKGLCRAALVRRWPVLREGAVVRLLRRRILEELDRAPCDVIHAHSPVLCGLAARQAARARNMPFVYEIRAFWEDAAVDQQKTNRASPRYQISRGLEGYVARRADAVVGIAQHILDDLAGRGLSREKLFHTPNGVDADRFPPRPRDSQLAAELGLGREPVFGFIGSWYRYEGLAWLVRAAAELRQRGHAFKLLLAGHGEDAEAITEAIRETGTGDCVLVVGRVPHDQVHRYYSVMDALVYPRLSVRLTELTTPLKPLEAMAQSKAVLASSVGGIRELIEHDRTGLLFAPGNVEDFCRQAERLIRQGALRRELGERARAAILREKDWKVIARRYEALYDFATAKRRGAPRPAFAEAPQAVSGSAR